MKLIGIRGAKGVGKNHVASLLAESQDRRDAGAYGHSDMEDWSLYEPSEVVGFADPLKQVVSTLFHIPMAILTGTDEDKSGYLSHYCWESLAMSLRYRYTDRKGRMSARELLQVFGTDTIRDLYGADFWVNHMKLRVAESRAPLVVIADVRFVNEVDWIRSEGGQVWLVTGPIRSSSGEHANTHRSERDLEGVPADCIVYNELGKSRMDLYEELEEKLRGVPERTSRKASGGPV